MSAIAHKIIQRPVKEPSQAGFHEVRKVDFDVDYAAVLKKALSGGGIYADIFIERSASFSLVCEDSRIEKALSGLDAGAGVRLIFENRTAYAYTNDISTASLLETADAVRQAARGASSSGDIDLRRKQPRADFTVLKAPEDIDAAVKEAMVLKADGVARSYDR